MMPSETVPSRQVALLARILKRERRAVADALTLVEQQAPAAADLISALRPHLGKALVVGITGPPGAGKSTLANGLIRHVRTSGQSVAVLAVDPSSPVSGGAILGDRIRMSAAMDDDGVLVRSLGSRGALGGLTPAAVRMIDVLDGAAFDLILIETVGTGQSEMDIAEVADLRIVVSAPGLGDDIQAMKAGLIEIADILVVNKADRDGAERTRAQLAGAVSLRADATDVPVLLTAAVSGRGIAELWVACNALRATRVGIDIDQRRRRRARYLIARAAAEIIEKRIRSEGGADLDLLTDDVLSGRRLPDEAARLLLSRTKP